MAENHLADEVIRNILLVWKRQPQNPFCHAGLIDRLVELGANEELLPLVRRLGGVSNDCAELMRTDSRRRYRKRILEWMETVGWLEFHLGNNGASLGDDELLSAKELGVLCAELDDEEEEQDYMDIQAELQLDFDERDFFTF